MASDYKNYAQALFELAKEENALEEIYGEINAVSGIFAENKDYFKIFSSPAVSAKEKTELIDEAFSSCRPTLIKFLKYLASYGALAVFSYIAKDFTELYYEEKGIISACVKSAVRLSDGEMEKLKEKLEAKTGKSVELSNVVVPELLGGAVLTYNGKEFDASLKAKLDLLKKGFL